MTEYVVDYAYRLPAWESITVSAENVEEAEQLALEDIKETFPDYLDIMIETVTEVKPLMKNF